MTTRGRDEEGFEAVFRAELPRLVRSLAVADGVEAAADAVQEAFVRAHERWATVGGLEDPAGWVRRVALNLLANRRRDERRRAEILAAVRPVDPATLGPADLDLLAAVGALPPQQRRCIGLHHVGGYPVAEIAEALGIAEGTVKSYLSDGRAALRRRLQEVPDDVA